MCTGVRFHISANVADDTGQENCTFYRSTCKFPLFSGEETRHNDSGDVFQWLKIWASGWKVDSNVCSHCKTPSHFQSDQYVLSCVSP